MKSLIRIVLRKLGYEIQRAEDRKIHPRLALHSCVGIDWNIDEATRFLAEVLPRYRAEFDAFPAAQSSSDRYFTANPYFGRVDAAVCHSFVRDLRPELVVEIGSGMSSRVIRGALDLNGAGRLVCIDPEPRADVSSVAHEWIRKPVQEIPASFFRDLPERALVFIDSSHLSGAHTDVNYLFLEMLPVLQPGTVIHVHDIYLPEDYPPQGPVYTEQYLLHALLCFSSAFRILWPGRKMLREREERLAEFFPDVSERGLHCSFWMERTA